MTNEEMAKQYAIAVSCVCNTFEVIVQNGESQNMPSIATQFAKALENINTLFEERKQKSGWVLLPPKIGDSCIHANGHQYANGKSKCMYCGQLK